MHTLSKCGEVSSSLYLHFFTFKGITDFFSLKAILLHEMDPAISYKKMKINH